MASDVRSQTVEVRDSSRVEQVMAAVCDSITETTTITIRENEQGDTIKVVQVTDRERVRNRDAIAVQKTKTEVRIDTVYAAVRDSVAVTTSASAPSATRASPWVSALKWVFWIIVGLSALIIIFKFQIGRAHV